MTQTDDTLLKEYFDKNKQDIADGGFARRVIHNLPDRKNRMARVVVLIGVVVSAVLFVLYGGLHAIIGVIREILVSVIQNGIAIFDPKSFLLVGAVLFCWGLMKIYQTN